MAKPDKEIARLNAMWEEGKRMRDLMSKDWSANLEMIKGDQLPPSRPAHKPPSILNKLRSVSERKIALMTDTKPRFEVTVGKKGEGFPEVAAVLKEVADAWWDDNGLDQVLARGLYYPITMGVMVAETHWSRLQNDMVLKMRDPRHFVFDPHIVSPTELHEAQYCVYEEFPPLAQVQMFYPGFKQELKPFVKPKGTWEKARESFMRFFGGGGGGQNQISREREGADVVQRCHLRHYWIQDYSTDKKVVKKGDKEHEVLFRKYPGGRYIILAGDTIIHDEANPYWDGTHPFDMMDWYVDIDTPWGLSEISALKNPQVLYNKLAEVIIENAMLMNNAIWVADQNTFDVDGWKQLTNVPGGIIKKRPGTELRREYPQGVPGTVMQLLTYLEQFIEKEPGILELTGKKPGQVQSGLGIEALQMMAAAMIRLKARALENMVQRIGQKVISRIIQFYTSDRIMHRVGPDGSFKEYVFVRDHFHKAYTAQALKDAYRDFRFRVTPGSSLSMTKTSKMLMAANLFELGVIDDQAILEATEWPDHEKILARTRAKQAVGLMPVPGGKKTGKKGAMQRQAKVAGKG